MLARLVNMKKGKTDFCSTCISLESDVKNNKLKDMDFVVNDPHDEWILMVVFTIIIFSFIYYYVLW